MAIYGTTNDNTTTIAANGRPVKTDYAKLIHNGKQYDNLETMVDRIARERAHVAFKSTQLAFKHAGSKANDETIAKALIEANKEMIFEYIKNKDDSRGLFGL